MDNLNLSELITKVLAQKAALNSDMYSQELENLLVAILKDDSLHKIQNSVKRREAVLREIIVNSSGSGLDFFNSIVIQLNKSLEADYTFIGEIISENPRTIRTIALCNKGQIIPNFEYYLEGTPCAEVLDRTVCAYPSDVQSIFPDDALLQQLSIEAYTGVPLFNSSGKALGILVSLYCRTISDTSFIESIMHIFSERIASEIERLNTQEALKESEKRYQHITESISDYIVKVYIEDGKAVKTIHGSACTIVTGYTQEEYNNDIYLWYKMIYEDDRRMVVDKIFNIIKGLDVKAFEHRIYHKNGTIRWLRNNPVLFYDEKNKLIEYDAIISDISELKTAELNVLESERQYKLLFNEMSSACALHEMIFDTYDNPIDYKFIDVNPVFEKMTGLKKDDIINKTVLEVLPNTEKYWIETYAQVAITGNPIKFENYSVSFDKYYEVLAYSPKKKFFAVIFNDITENRKSQQALEDSEARYRTLVELSPDAICVYSNQKLVYVNKAGVKLIGAKSIDDLIGTDIMQFVHPDYKEIVIQRSKNAIIRNEISPVLEEKFIKLDGTVIDVEVTAAPVNHNNIPSVQVIIRDITDKKRAEEKLKYERDFNALITETVPVGITILDHDGNIIFSNQRAEIILGIDKNNIVGRSYNSSEWKITDLNGNPIDKENLPFMLVKKSKKSVYDYKHELSWPSGKKIILSINGSPILNDNNEFVGAITTLNDITSQIYSEKELLKAKNQAEESDKLKSAFLANMSHEIRTPMNGIIGFASLLSKTDLAADKRKKYVNIIQNSTSQLLSIITDILDISKIEAGQMTINKHRFSLNQLMDDLLTQFEVEKKQKLKETLELKVIKDFKDIESEIISDKSRISQIFINLIGNALKFTNQGYIEFGYKLINKEKLIFFVRDTGIGIPYDKQSIIFERFRQADDSTTRKFGGTGLGLAICKGLVELLDGKIWVESYENRGSVFYFSIEYNPGISFYEKTDDNMPGENITYTFEDYNILVVEDVEDNFILIEEFLSETKAKLILTKDGISSIEYVKNHKDVDLILMDIQLPDISGYEAAVEIKKINPAIPIVAQTAYGLSGDREKALENGCDDYIAKPILKSALLKLIQHYFNLR